MLRVLGLFALVLALVGTTVAAAHHTPSAGASGQSATTLAPSTTAVPVVPEPTTVAPGLAPAGQLAPVAPAPAGVAAAAAPGLVVADAGNSILYDAEPAIAAVLGPARFFPHTIGGFGVSVLPDMWRGVFGHDVPADDPAAVVVLLGNRDFTAALTDPVTYRSQLDESVRMLSSRGARILWLGLPPLPPSPTDELGRRAVNALFAELPARFPGVVRYVPTDGVLGGPDGSFVRTVPGVDGPIRKVKPDGTGEEHLCPEGAVRLAGLIRTELASIVSVPAAPAGWEQAAWRAEPRYDNPPAGCRP